MQTQGNAFEGVPDEILHLVVGFLSQNTVSSEYFLSMKKGVKKEEQSPAKQEDEQASEIHAELEEELNADLGSYTFHQIIPLVSKRFYKIYCVQKKNFSCRFLASTKVPKQKRQEQKLQKVNTKVILSDFGKFPNLENIEIGVNLYSEAAKAVPFLNVVGLNNMALVSDGLLGQISLQFRHTLRVLNVAGNKQISPHQILKILNTCSKLEVLDISMCSGLSVKLGKILVSGSTNSSITSPVSPAVTTFPSSSSETPFQQVLPKQLKVLNVTHLESFGYDEVIYLLQHSNLQHIGANHLVGYQKFNKQKFLQLAEISLPTARRLYDAALTNVYENSFLDIAEVFDDYPSQSTIENSLIHGNYKIISLLHRLRYPVSEMISVDVICKALLLGNSGIVGYLNLAGYTRFNEIPIQIIAKIIENNLHICIIALRTVQYDKWNQIPVQSVNHAIRNGFSNIIEQLSFLNYNFDQISIDAVHEAILKGYTNALKQLSSSKFSKWNGVDPEVIKTAIRAGSIPSVANFLLLMKNYDKGEQIIAFMNEERRQSSLLELENSAKKGKKKEAKKTKKKKGIE